MSSPFISEPTNNVPPRAPGKKSYGGELILVKQTQNVFLMCEVTGFPVPLFK